MFLHSRVDVRIGTQIGVRLSLLPNILLHDVLLQFNQSHAIAVAHRGEQLGLLLHSIFLLHFLIDNVDWTAQLPAASTDLSLLSFDVLDWAVGNSILRHVFLEFVVLKTSG